MKRESPKTAKINRANAAWRKAFVLEAGRCQMPDCSTPLASLHVHEIGRGCHRQNTKLHRLACLVVCDSCNQGPLCDYSVWPIERQLALKLLTDPKHFDLVAFCNLCGAPYTWIDGNDLLPHLQELLTSFPGVTHQWVIT